MAEDDTMAKETKEKEAKIEITIEDLINEIRLLKGQMAYVLKHKHDNDGTVVVPLELV